jgi:hypothetical protein
MKPMGKQRAFQFIVLAAFLPLAGHAPAALADCVSSCLAAHECETESDTSRTYSSGSQCQKFEKGCEAQCRRESTSYGAIAYDEKSGAWGMSDSMPDEHAAADSATVYCGQHGADCTVVETFHNDCGAVAQGDEGVVTWAKASTAEEAQDHALKACADQKGGASCQAKLSNCYFP